MVNKESIKASIIALMNDMIERTDVENAEQSREDFAEELSTIIKDAITSATVTVNSGIAVQVNTGTGTGATVSTGSGNLT